MATFMLMTAWRGEYSDDYFAQLPADPAAFGMPAEDDGLRDDPLLSGRSWAVSSYRPDQQPTVFPSHHGGFLGPEFGYPGQPEAFAVKLRTVLNGS